jgi:hypothetical protein
MNTVVFRLYPVAWALYDLKVPEPQDENDKDNHDQEGHGAKPPAVDFPHDGIKTGTPQGHHPRIKVSSKSAFFSYFGLSAFNFQLIRFEL